MKALNFVIGMIVGMVLLVVAVVGAIFAAGTLVSVGQLESTLGTDIFDDESSVNEMTILDLVQKIIDDAQNPDTLTINKLITDYGIRIPGEVSGIDISVLFDYPVTEVPDHLGDVVNNMTLRDVGEFLAMDFESEYPELAILQDNLDNNVNVALDNILSSIDDETMTIYSIERSFGLSLGSNNLIETLYHTPLSSFAAVMDNLPVGIVADADSDLFVPDGETELFVLTDVYEEVPADELLSPDAADGAETYIAGADDNGLIYRELRFVLDDDGSYIPDNSCYASSFDAEASDKTFYRHIIYSPFDPAADYDETAVLAVPTLLNNFVSDGEGGFALADGGMTELTTVFVSADMSVSLSEAILSGAVLTSGGSLDFSSIDIYVPSTDGNGAELAAEFGLADGVTPDGNTRLDDNYTGWLRIHTGTADPAMQIIAGETLKTVSGATDKITSLKLGEVIDITDDSAKILQTLADTPINKMSDALDTLTLSDATDIVMSEYTPSADGAYVLTADGYYTLYNPSDASHAGLQRYDKTSVEGESSQALQRLANVTIPNISSAFSDIVLGDVLSVEADSFRVAEDPVNGEVYYVFNDLGYPERVVYDENTPAGGTLYERVSEGGGNAVLKQLAYVKIDNISAAMDGIIENTLLSDIIDIAEYTSAEVSEGTGSWLFAYNPDFTVGEGAEAEHYTFVYDGSGKYYMTDTLYLEAEDGQLVQAGTAAYWTYESNAAYSSVTEILTARDGGKNVWFFEDGEYVQNPALVAYCAAQANAGNSGEALKVLRASFSRVQATPETPGASSSPVYANAEGAAAAAGGLYVRSEEITGFGGYEPYDPDDITHHGVQLYFRYAGGYYPASSERLADDSVTKYSFDFTEGYVPYTGSGTAYVTLPAVTEGDGARTVYYYTLIDSGYEEGYVTYSMRECEYIFLRAADGEYAKVNGEYVLYDADVHGTDADRYDRVIGYIGNDAANDGGTGLTPLSSVEVDVLEEKSPVILTSLLARQITIGSMSDVIDTLTVEELMEIEPGSVFDSEELRTATIDDISSRITAMFTSMTVGQLLEYANVSVSAEIAYILSDVHITDFFSALTFNPDTAAIEVDMYKLFGVGA